MSSRLAKLRESLAAEAIDAIIVTQPENRRYMSGFTGSSAVLLISAQHALLATDFRYYEQMARQSPDFCLTKIESSKIGPVLNQMVHETGARRVGFECQHVTVDMHQEWTDAAESFELVPAKGIVETIRAIKDEEELAAIRRAVALSDGAVQHIKEVIQPGMTEKEIAWEMESYIRTHGADQLAFPIIAASGPNGAMPHAVTSDRIVLAGEPIVMDLGARVDGYNSDLTRTIYIGEPDERFREVYDLVLKAQLAAEGAIRPGMQGKEADAVAREVITEAGYGEYFGHGLGHGVGLAVHEKPSAGKTSEDVLLPGSVVTVEPGIYIPGWGGVRIEDMVVVTDHGVDVLSQATKDPIVKQ